MERWGSDFHTHTTPSYSHAKRRSISALLLDALAYLVSERAPPYVRAVELLFAYLLYSPNISVSYATKTGRPTCGLSDLGRVRYIVHTTRRTHLMNEGYLDIVAQHY